MRVYAPRRIYAYGAKRVQDRLSRHEAIGRGPSNESSRAAALDKWVTDWQSEYEADKAG